MLKFYKYQATGNDFVIIDNRQSILNIKKDVKTFKRLCHRRLGIGADGILLLSSCPNNDFKMEYANADGKEASMCGNGARAISHFAKYILKLDQPLRYVFSTVNGCYESIVEGDEVKVRMSELYDLGKISLEFIRDFDHKLYLNTGVPHVVLFCEKKLDEIDLIEIAMPLRHHDAFLPQGANINLVHKLSSDFLQIRTFERGVEGETLSCGTGVVASAIAHSKIFAHTPITRLETKAGVLEVSIDKDFKNIWLSGEVKLVYEGAVNLL